MENSPRRDESRGLLRGEAAAGGEEEEDEKLKKETEDEVLRETIKEEGPDEPKRSMILFLSLYEVFHGQSRVLHLPTDTLYTACIVMPMIARSSGYTLTMTVNSAKMFVLTLACIVLQCGLISSFYHARTKLPGLDGVPSLCTYGQDVGEFRTPYGPTGQIMRKDYRNVETDYTNLMVRNTLVQVMEKFGIENEILGPVEYGMESMTCRAVCIMVFCIGICGDVLTTGVMLKFLAYSPTLRGSSSDSGGASSLEDDDCKKGQWVCFDSAAKESNSRSSREDQLDPKEIWSMIGKSSLDHISFRCSGMPLSWKAVSFGLLVARLTICWFTFWNGLSFLMNTGKILELILNSLALTFIIEMDKLMFATFARGMPKDIVDRLEPFHVRARTGELRSQLEAKKRDEVDWSCCDLLRQFLSFNLITLALVAVTVVGHVAVFYRHCSLQVWPFNPHELGHNAYFQGQTRFFGGWEWIFGSWVSKDTVDSYTGDVTCVPAWHAPFGPERVQPIGCGLPENWTIAL